MDYPPDDPDENSEVQKEKDPIKPPKESTPFITPKSENNINSLKEEAPINTSKPTSSSEIEE